MSTPHPHSISTFMLLEGPVMKDMVDSLSGSWSPGIEPDVVRRSRLVDAARLRLYGEIDRSSWYLCTTKAVHDSLPHQGHGGWVVSLVATIDSYDDSPAEDDVASLTAAYVDDQGLDPESADVLAHAVLYEPVRYLVTNDVRSYRHNRDHDLPGRLEIITPADAVGMLNLIEGEEPLSEPPPDWPTADVGAWWIP